MKHKEQVAGHRGHDLRTHTNPPSLLKGATQTWVIRQEKKREVRRPNDRCSLESGQKLVTVLRSLSWDIDGVLWSPFWELDGVLWSPFWELDGVLWSPFWELDGVLWSPFWELDGVLWSSFWELDGVLWSPF